MYSRLGLCAPTAAPAAVFGEKHAKSSNAPARAQLHRAVTGPGQGGMRRGGRPRGGRRAGPARQAGKDGKESGTFGDDLLDFMYAGKKLRRWYGAEGKVLPRNGRPAGQKEEQQAEGAAEEEDAGVPRDTVVVLDADGNAMAEQVVLQLILKRAKVRVVVRDVGAAKQAFGPYVEAVPGDSSDAALLLRTLRGAKAAVACGPLGKLLPAAAAARLPRLVLLSSVGAVGPSGFAALPFSAAAREAAVLGDASREAEVAGAASLRHTIVQVAVLTDSPGASSELRLTAGGKAGGAISREDAARVLAEAAEWEGNPSFVLQAAAGAPGEPPTDWSAVFDALQPVPAA